MSSRNKALNVILYVLLTILLSSFVFALVDNEAVPWDLDLSGSYVIGGIAYVPDVDVLLIGATMHALDLGDRCFVLLDDGTEHSTANVTEVGNYCNFTTQDLVLSAGVQYNIISFKSDRAVHTVKQENGATYPVDLTFGDFSNSTRFGDGGTWGAVPFERGTYGFSILSIDVDNETPIPIAYSSFIDLLFKNSTGSYTNTMGEGEDFLTFINWTVSPYNESIANLSNGGVCNVTHVNTFIEEVAADDNFTVCTSGCDYVSYSETFTGVETTNAMQDYNYFYACHEQVASGILYANISCASGSYRETISAIQLPLCSDGNAIIRINTSVCIGDSDVSIKVNGKNSPYSQRKRITNLHYDRQFSIHTDDATYNASLGLWELGEGHEYYAYGTRTVYANCSFQTNSTFDNSTTESLTIVNAGPVIFFAQVNTTLGLTDLADGVVIQYAAGVWNWLVSIVDTDAQHFNASWYNSSGYSLASIAGNPAMFGLNTSDGLFVAFVSGNSYFLNVTVNDTFGAETNGSLMFNVTDTLPPSCNFEAAWGDLPYNFTFNVSCADEHFFSLNVTCPANNLTFNVTGLDVTSYFFNETWYFNVTDTCSFIYCDGHTDNVVAFEPVISFDKSRVELVDLSGRPSGVVSVAGLNEITPVVRSDRISFNVKINDLGKAHKVYYEVPPDAVYLQSDEYFGWIVSLQARSWFDFNNDFGIRPTVKRVNATLFELTFVTNEKFIVLESVGSLNCVSGSFGVGDEFDYAIEVGVCSNDSTASVLLLWLVLGFACFLVTLGLAFRLRFLGILGSVILIPLSWSVIACDYWTGLVMFAVGLLLLLFFSMKD